MENKNILEVNTHSLFDEFDNDKQDQKDSSDDDNILEERNDEAEIISFGANIQPEQNQQHNDQQMTYNTDMNAQQFYNQRPRIQQIQQAYSMNVQQVLNPQQLQLMQQTPQNFYPLPQSSHSYMGSGGREVKAEIQGELSIPGARISRAQDKHLLSIMRSQTSTSNMYQITQTTLKRQKTHIKYFKEQLYEDRIVLKRERNQMSRENKQIKAFTLQLKKELKRKDEIIQNLVISMKADAVTEQLQFGQKKQSVSQLQLAYKTKIRELNNDLVLKNEEINTLQRTLKYTKIQELELEVKEFEKEAQRLYQKLLQSYQRPVVDLMVHQQVLEQISQKDQMLTQLQLQLDQVKDLMQKRDLQMKKKTSKISRLRESVKGLKERNKLMVKKNMVLQAKLQENLKAAASVLSNDSQFRPGRSRQGSTNENQRSQRSRTIDWEEQYKREKQRCEYFKSKLQQNNIRVEEEVLSGRHISIDKIQKIMIQLGEQEVWLERTSNLTFEELIQSLEELMKVDKGQFILKNEEEKVVNSFEDMSKQADGNLKVFVEAADNENDEEDYEEDEFEKFEENQIKALSLEDVSDYLLELKLKAQIKKVEISRIHKYLLHGIKKEGKKIQDISLKELQTLLQSRFKFNSEAAQKLARFLSEKPNSDNKVVFSEAATVTRYDLKQKIHNFIDSYPIYNGLKMTGYINKLINELEDVKGEMEGIFSHEDKFQTGFLSLHKIFDILFKDLQIGHFSADLQEFFVYFLFRQSHQVSKINYSAFLQIFTEDYLVPPSTHEDSEECNFSSDTQQETSVRIEKQDVSQQNEIEVNENELMVLVDDVIQKVVANLPPKPVQSIYKQLQPIMKTQTVQNYKVQYINIEDFSKFLKVLLKGDLSDKELSCILHILEKEDMPDVVLFDDIRSIIKNYQKKERMFRKSLDMGLRYDLIDSESLEFIATLKNLNQQNDENQDKNISTVLKKVIQIQTVKTLTDQKKVETITFESLIDFLFMKYQIRCPSQNVQHIVQQLFCIDQKYPEVILVKKLQKILTDLDFVYVNLFKHCQKPFIQPKVQPKQSPSLKAPTVAPTQPKKQKEVQQKGVKFEEQPQVKKKEEDEFQFDQFRQKYTMKAEEVAEEIYSEDFNEKEDEQAEVIQTWKQGKKEEKVKVQDQREEKVKVQDQKPEKESDDYVEDYESDQGEKMDFEYDEFRKKYTQKPEEVEEEIEDYYD